MRLFRIYIAHLHEIDVSGAAGANTKRSTDVDLFARMRMIVIGYNCNGINRIHVQIRIPARIKRKKENVSSQYDVLELHGTKIIKRLFPA